MEHKSTCDIALHGDHVKHMAGLKAGDEVEIHHRGKVVEARTEEMSEMPGMDTPANPVTDAVMGKKKGAVTHRGHLRVELNDFAVTPKGKGVAKPAAKQSAVLAAVLGAKSKK